MHNIIENYSNILIGNSIKVIKNKFIKLFIFINTLLFISMASIQNCCAQGSNSWELNGNAIYEAEFIGTTNNMPLIFKTNKNEGFRLNSNGNVGIANTSPVYKLDVCGTIRSTQEIIVEPSDSSCQWPDFVFDSSFQLQLFNERIELIRSQKHLPFIPSSTDIKDNGMPVYETIKGIIQNIEELYLYMEQMERRIEQLEEENHNLKELLPKESLK
ncbi:MAG: hypothetical protein WBH46_04330 [Bacteroidales bacterium]